MSIFRVHDLMEVEGPHDHAISFVVEGSPPVQLRHRTSWYHRARPVFYDPSGRSKRDYMREIRASMTANGVEAFPYFPLGEPLFLKVCFYLPRPRQDLRTVNGVRVLTAHPSRYPKTKDLDNMLKFVMDALDGLMYHDDINIVTVVMAKRFPEDVLSGGRTEVHLSNSPVHFY